MKKKIFVAGHAGMLGSAILRCLMDNDHYETLTKTRKELDLKSQQVVDSF